VLCDLAVKAGVPVDVRDSSNRTYYNDDVYLPPAVVRDWAGMPKVIELDFVNEDGDDDTAEIAALNDGYGYDFSQLAQLIEDQL
jgi:hypothetical protein